MFIVQNQNAKNATGGDVITQPLNVQKTPQQWFFRPLILLPVSYTHLTLPTKRIV